jgi:hypothetical protein
VYQINLKNFNDLDENNVWKKKLNIINPNKFENEIKKESNVFAIVVEKVLENFLVKSLKVTNKMIKEFLYIILLSFQVPVFLNLTFIT